MCTKRRCRGPGAGGGDSRELCLQRGDARRDGPPQGVAEGAVASRRCSARPFSARPVAASRYNQAARTMPLPAGQRLGPYEVVSAIGAGGMGEVYKAKDTRLDRTVAIKVLPAASASDPEFRARFEREARTILAAQPPAYLRPLRCRQSQQHRVPRHGDISRARRSPIAEEGDRSPSTRPSSWLRKSPTRSTRRTGWASSTAI